jgi:hypothetical protein
MFEIAGGILLAVLVLALLPLLLYIVVAALWLAAAVAVIALIVACVMNPDLGVGVSIAAVVIGIYIYYEVKAGDQEVAVKMAREKEAADALAQVAKLEKKQQREMERNRALERSMLARGGEWVGVVASMKERGHLRTSPSE